MTTCIIMVIIISCVMLGLIGIISDNKTEKAHQSSMQLKLLEEILKPKATVHVQTTSGSFSEEFDPVRKQVGAYVDHIQSSEDAVKEYISGSFASGCFQDGKGNYFPVSQIVKVSIEIAKKEDK